MSANYIAFRVPGTDMHMTVCYIHTLQPSERSELLQDMAQLARAVVPLQVTMGKRDMFGEKKDIPVVHVDVPEKARIEMQAFYTKWCRPRPGRTERAVPTYHISLAPADTTALKEGSTIELVDLYVKEIERKAQ